jgi:hypothetical protein
VEERVFVSEPIDGAVSVAQHRTRGGKVLIWTAVPPDRAGPETSLYRTQGTRS